MQLKRRNRSPDLLERNPEQKTANTFIGGQTWLGYACQLGKLNAAKKELVRVGLDVNAGDNRTELDRFVVRRLIIT